MLDKMKHIKNPLTVIGLFAALAEVAMAASMFALPPDLQHIFMWFVMAFPLLLVLLFFITLNFNPKVLYAPSDYQDETNFVQIITQQRMPLPRPRNTSSETDEQDDSRVD